jgi:hypothetical protein
MIDQDSRVMQLVRQFSDNPPYEYLIAKDWEMCFALAERLTVKQEPHIFLLLEQAAARVEAWSILNPDRVPQGVKE